MVCACAGAARTSAASSSAGAASIAAARGRRARKSAKVEAAPAGRRRRAVRRRDGRSRRAPGACPEAVKGARRMASAARQECGTGKRAARTSPGRNSALGSRLSALGSRLSALFMCNSPTGSAGTQRSTRTEAIALLPDCTLTDADRSRGRIPFEPRSVRAHDPPCGIARAATCELSVAASPSGAGAAAGRHAVVSARFRPPRCGFGRHSDMALDLWIAACQALPAPSKTASNAKIHTREAPDKTVRQGLGATRARAGRVAAPAARKRTTCCFEGITSGTARHGGSAAAIRMTVRFRRQQDWWY